MSVRDDYPAITILADACVAVADDSVPEAVRAWREVARLRQWKAEAAREVQRLRQECKAWMNGVADVVEPLGYDRGAASGPSDLLPGLTDLRVHGMEMARRLHECVEARSYLYEQTVELSRGRHVD